MSTLDKEIKSFIGRYDKDQIIDFLSDDYDLKDIQESFSRISGETEKTSRKSTPKKKELSDDEEVPSSKPVKGDQIKIQRIANEKETMIDLLTQKWDMDLEGKKYSIEEFLFLFQDPNKYDKKIVLKVLKSDIFHLLYFMRLFYEPESMLTQIQKALDDKTYKKEQLQDTLSKVKTSYPEEYSTYQKVFKIRGFLEKKPIISTQTNNDSPKKKVGSGSGQKNDLDVSLCQDESL